MMEGTLKAATAEERNINKAAFLHVLSRFVGSEVKVIAVEHTMGGVFYTATPHTHNNFLVVIKVSRIEEVRVSERDLGVAPFSGPSSQQILPGTVRYLLVDIAIFVVY